MTDTITVRVLTLNVWNTESDTSRQDLLRDGIAALDPDLVSLQEVVRTDAYDQLPAILAGTSLHRVHQLDVLDAPSAGTALASRWQPTTVEGALLPGQGHMTPLVRSRRPPAASRLAPGPSCPSRCPVHAATIVEILAEMPQDAGGRIQKHVLGADTDTGRDWDREAETPGAGNETGWTGSPPR